jgi:2-amino-4-hydroxy-6-hydroxymethyldihydropteridine diphosphokinase
LQSRQILIAMGANVAGRWGSPRQTLARTVQELETCSVVPLAGSAVYRTTAVGIGRQPDFLNAVILVETQRPPADLLRLFKQLERLAGRRFCRGSGSRPLDLDIIAYRGQRIGRPIQRRDRGLLIVPHPEAAKRAFVLRPVADVAPHWSDRALGGTLRARLARLPQPPGAMSRSLDFVVDPCE